MAHVTKKKIIERALLVAIIDDNVQEAQDLLKQNPEFQIKNYHVEFSMIAKNMENIERALLVAIIDDNVQQVQDLLEQNPEFQIKNYHVEFSMKYCSCIQIWYLLLNHKANNCNENIKSVGIMKETKQSVGNLDEAHKKEITVLLKNEAIKEEVREATKEEIREAIKEEVREDITQNYDILIGLVFICLFMSTIVFFVKISYPCNNCVSFTNAVLSNNLSCITELQSKYTPNQRHDYETAINHAAVGCRVNAFNQLILRGYDISRSSDNNYAIRHASKNGCVQIVKSLLLYPEVDPTSRHNSALLHAVTNEHIDVVKYLLDNQEVTNTLFLNGTIWQDKWKLIIGVAIKSKNIEIMNLLVNKFFEKQDSLITDEFYHYAKYSDTKCK